MPQSDKKKEQCRPTRDDVVVYYAHGDKCWIAHSLQTDQIAIGKSVLDSLYALAKSTGDLLMLAQEHPDIVVMRGSSASIAELAELLKDARPLSKAVVRGTWISDAGPRRRDAISYEPRRENAYRGQLLFEPSGSVAVLESEEIDIEAIDLSYEGSEPLKLLIELGDATEQNVTDFLIALSDLYRTMGGSGLDYEVQ